MNAQELIRELGRTLGGALELSPAGTCRAAFDSDVVDFEEDGASLWIFADLGSALHREDASQSLLAANRLGLQTGGATIALDEERSMFVMHMELWSDMPYPSFEAKLTLFIKALRWWKEWLALPPLRNVVSQVRTVEGTGRVEGVADGIMEEVYAPFGMNSGMLKI